MRKLVARSIAVGLTAVLLSGCSSTGGQKSFSWSSLNPMTYFADSDDDSPVPKPTDQMAPTVTLPNASDVAESGGTAPPSPYGQTSAGDAVQTAATQVASGAINPQRGMYDPNGYGGSSLPLSSGTEQYGTQASASTGYSLPPSGVAVQQAAQSGYQLPAAPAGYEAGSTAQYALGGGSYDIQRQPQGSNPGLPAYTNPTAPYGNSAAPSVGVSSAPYQAPTVPAPPNGYDVGLAQDPSGSMAPFAYPSSVTGTPQNAYASSPTSSSGETADLVASMPKLPPLPDQYQSSPPAYNPGSTSYNPPNVPAYTPPAPGGYVQPATATESSFAPGSVTRYPSTQASGTTVPSGAYGTTGSIY